MKVTRVSGSDDTVKVSSKKGDYFVQHVEDYGVLVRGTTSTKRARKVLIEVGYPVAGVQLWPCRPTMVDQEEPEGFGSAHGGTPAVAFYFEVGS